jgi:hypothetical protein
LVKETKGKERCSQALQAKTLPELELLKEATSTKIQTWEGNYLSRRGETK